MLQDTGSWRLEFDFYDLYQSSDLHPTENMWEIFKIPVQSAPNLTKLVLFFDRQTGENVRL